MSAALKKITTTAKQLRKKHPGMSWQGAIKKAGAMYRGTAKKTVKKKAVKKTVAKKAHVKTHKKHASVKTGKIGIGVGSCTVSGLMAQGKKMLITDIGKLEAQKFAAKLKRDKNKIAKKIAEKKRAFRKLA